MFSINQKACIAISITTLFLKAHPTKFILKQKLKMLTFLSLLIQAEHSQTRGNLMCQLQDHPDHPLETEPERGARV